MSTPISPAPWDLVRRLFDAASGLPEPEQDALLADPSHPAAVVAEVRSLLAHDRTRGVLDRPARAPTRIGQRLGAWRITELLGRGGMGEVWAARRADGRYDGEAAIKLLRAGMGSGSVLARFAQEQQVLARLAHPHIAHLIDAGLSDDGLPYFVMERVHGQPIDQACAGRPLEQRLALFLQLADAVAHAHRHLLVHRDLKPSNVLVTADDQVKLLDFGIAKALVPDTTPAARGDEDLAALTQHGQDLFTPHYASPEQVRGEPVGTATDVYSLGVLLYVLLTGQRPHGRNATSPFDAARAVLDEAPQRPSLAGPPGAEGAPARRRLRGDLDNILLKALAKPAAERYPTVEALASDVRAHLQGHPVSARRASVGYVVSRFVRRHRVGVAVGALALAGVVAGAAMAVWQAHEAAAQRDVAQQRLRQVRQLAKQLVFKYHDAIENLPGATKAREALLTDAASFLDGMADEAEDDPEFAYELASTYYRISRLQGLDVSINIGQHSAAEASLTKALAAAQGFVDWPGASTESIGLAISMHVSHGELWQRRGRMAQAQEALQQGLPLLQRTLAQHPRDTWALSSAITLHGVLARIQGSSLGQATLGRWREACHHADKARAAAQAMLDADPANVYGPDSLAFTLGEQAHCRALSGRTDEAVDLFTQQRALRDQMASRFPDDLDFLVQRAVVRGNLAHALAAQGRHAAARGHWNEADALARQAAAKDPDNRAAQARIDALRVINLRLALAAGDARGAATQADEALRALPPLRSDSVGEAQRRAEVMLLAARAHRPAGAAQALAYGRAAAALLQPGRDGDDNATRRWLLAQALGEQALAHQALGDTASATDLARQALAQWQDPAGAPPTDGPPPALQPHVAQVRALVNG